MEESIVLYNSEPHHLVSSLNGALEGLALQSKAQMNFLFQDIETAIKIKPRRNLENVTQGHNRREQVRRFDLN